MKNTKRRFLIVAVMVLLLVAVLAMSVSTFAKYTTTTGVQSNSATVAKWGFVVAANATDLFGTAYASDANTATTQVVVKDNTNGTAIKSTATTPANLLAPGASGSMTFSIDGTAEVLAKVTVEANGTDISIATGGNTYYPITWTLTKGGTPVTGCEDVQLSAILNYLNAGDKDELIDAGEEYAFAGEYELTWVWAFDGDGVASGLTDLDRDAADTLLGRAAEAGKQNGETFTYEGTDYTVYTQIAFDITISVDQTQPAYVAAP